MAARPRSLRDVGGRATAGELAHPRARDSDPRRPSAIGTEGRPRIGICDCLNRPALGARLFRAPPAPRPPPGYPPRESRKGTERSHCRALSCSAATAGRPDLAGPVRICGRLLGRGFSVAAATSRPEVCDSRQAPVRRAAAWRLPCLACRAETRSSREAFV